MKVISAFGVYKAGICVIPSRDSSAKVMTVPLSGLNASDLSGSSHISLNKMCAPALNHLENGVWFCSLLQLWEK